MYIEGCRYFAGLRPVRAVRTLFDLNLPQRVCRPFRMGFPVKPPGKMPGGVSLPGGALRPLTRARYFRAYSSVGESARLISARSLVQIQVGPPAFGWAAGARKWRSGWDGLRCSTGGAAPARVKSRRAWGCSSAGRAPGLQPGGQRFDPAHLHQGWGWPGHWPPAAFLGFRAEASSAPCSLTTESRELAETGSVELRSELSQVSVKLLRAYGGCLGASRRRRTWPAAISLGEPLAGFDPGISEWGNPLGLISQNPPLNP